MKAEDVAKYIINRGIYKKVPVTAFELNKILYILHRLTDILDDPNFTYTEYDPRITSIYEKYRRGSLPLYFKQDCEITLTNEQDKIIDGCLKFNMSDLIRICESDELMLSIYNKIKE